MATPTLASASPIPPTASPTTNFQSNFATSRSSLSLVRRSSDLPRASVRDDELGPAKGILGHRPAGTGLAP